jgi:hypothetical protein
MIFVGGFSENYKNFDSCFALDTNVIPAMQCNKAGFLGAAIVARGIII